MPTKLTLSLAIAALLALAGAGPAQAAPTVSNTNDAGAGSLRQAIVEAGAGETITVPSGTYSLSSEPLAIEKNLTLAGAGSGATIIRSVGPYRVFNIEPAAAAQIEVTLTDMMIRDGRVFAKTAQGGGILAIKANLVLRRVRLTGNIADSNGEEGGAGGSSFGGGAFVLEGALTVSDSEIYGNTALALGEPGFKGGTAQGGGLIVAGGPFNLESTSVSGNTANAAGGQGPANAAQDGGSAIAAGIVTVAIAGPTNISSSTVSGNVAESPPGPGGSAGEVAGGGIFSVAPLHPVALTNSTVTGNIARNGPSEGAPGVGGGLFMIAVEKGTTTITSSTIAGNRLESSTPESQGGNIVAVSVAPAAIVFRNSIVSSGVGPAGTENCSKLVPEAAPFVSQGFNLDSKDQCNFKGTGDKVNTDPLLGPLQANGGLTQTMAPATNSPVIDQGAAFGLTTDQRGVVRPIDLPTIPNSAVAGADGSDIGAHELQPSSAFTFGKIKKNKKKGTATVGVKLPQPSAGTLTLTGKGLKKQTLPITGQAEVKLKIAAKSKAIKKALKKKGKRKVKFEVTYTPTGNTAATQSKTTKLVKKKKKRRKKGGK
jgi:hypothetical protein